MSAGITFAEAIQARMPGRVRCLPTFILDADQPTTIGLGDTFVGGFLASLAGATVMGGD